MKNLCVRGLCVLVLGSLSWPTGLFAHPAYRLSLGSYLETPVETDDVKLVSVFQMDYPLATLFEESGHAGLKVTVANHLPAGLGSDRKSPYRLRTSLVTAGGDVQLNFPSHWGSASRIGLNLSLNAGVMTARASPEDTALVVHDDDTILGAWSASLAPTITLFDAGSYRFSTYLGALAAGGFGKITMEEPGRKITGYPWSIGFSAGLSFGPKPKASTAKRRMPRSKSKTLKGYVDRTPPRYYDLPPKLPLPPDGCPVPFNCPFTESGPRTQTLAAMAQGDDLERFHALNELFIGQLHDRTPHRTRDRRKQLAERSSEDIFKSGWRDGCIDAATAYTGLLRAAGIPVVFIHGIDDAWVRGSLRQKRALKHYRGHTFVEVWLQDRWYLVDPSRMVLYRGYSPLNDNLPDNYRVQFKAGDLAAVGIQNRSSLYRAMRLFLKTGPRARRGYRDPAYDELRLNIPLNALKKALNGTPAQDTSPTRSSGSESSRSSNSGTLSMSGFPRQSNGHYELWQDSDIGLRHVWSFNLRDGEIYDQMTKETTTRMTSQVPMNNVKWWGIGYRPENTDSSEPPSFILSGQGNTSQSTVELTMYHQRSWEIELPRHPIALTVRAVPGKDKYEARLCKKTKGGWYPRVWQLPPRIELEHRLTFRIQKKNQTIRLGGLTESSAENPLCIAPGAVFDKMDAKGPFRLDIYGRPMQSQMKPLKLLSLSVNAEGTRAKRVMIEDLPRAELTLE